MTATVSVEIEPASPQFSPMRRVANLDVLRAVAALAVLGIHAYALGGRVAPVKAQHFYDVPLLTLASGVWLFFAVSGYVISKPFVDRMVAGQRSPNISTYALRRTLRIFPLYWVALTAVIAIDGAAGTKAWQFPIHYLLLNNLVPGRQEALFSAAWTLTLEVLFYAAVPVLAALVSRRKPVDADRLARLVLVSWALSIAFTALADLKGDDTIGLWLRGSLPAMWQMFCPGILLAIAPHLHASRGRKLLVALPQRHSAALLAALALLVGAVVSTTAPLRFGVVPYQLLVDGTRPLFAIGYGLVLAWAIRARPWHAGWALELGFASYGIYLIHPVIEAFLLKHGLSPVHEDSAFGFFVNCLVLAALTIPFALASWHWLERPGVGLARRLGGATHRTPAS